MTSNKLKEQYLLPGECNKSSSIVQTHGKCQDLSSKQRFLSIARIYVPEENDFVIGIVIVRTPDLFLVDINSPESAVLPIPSFDNGRLPSRSAMNRLSVVYARVVRADPWAQTELSCQTNDKTNKKHLFGLISDGHIIRCSLSLCAKLQHSQIINYFKNNIKTFSIRYTMNGFIWYKTDTLHSMIAIKQVLYEYEYENNIEYLKNLYDKIMFNLQQQDNSLIKVKQHQIGTKSVDIKPVNNAMTRLVNQIIRNMVDNVIDNIVKNENT